MADVDLLGLVRWVMTYLTVRDDRIKTIIWWQTLKKIWLPLLLAAFLYEAFWHSVFHVLFKSLGL